MELQRVTQAIPFNENILYPLLGCKPTVASVLRLHKSKPDSVRTNRLAHNECVIHRS